MRCVRRLLLVALAALPLAVALPLAAQTPTPGVTVTPGPTASPATDATPGPALAGASATPAAASPSPTPNPLVSYNPFLLAAILQQSDLPAGDIIVLQFPAAPNDVSDAITSLNVTVAGAFFQLFAPLNDVESGSGGGLGALFGAVPGQSYGADAIYLLGSAQDASTVLRTIAQLGGIAGDASDLSQVQMVQPPPLGDEALELTAIETEEDPDTGVATTLNLDLIAVRRGRVDFFLEIASDADPRGTTEAVASALDARVQKALPLLPAQ